MIRLCAYSKYGKHFENNIFYLCASEIWFENSKFFHHFFLLAFKIWKPFGSKFNPLSTFFRYPIVPFPNFLALFQTPLSFFVCVELSIRVIGIHRANELDHRLEQCRPVFFQPAACQLHWCAFNVTKSHFVFHSICVCQIQMCPWDELKDSLRLISGQWFLIVSHLSRLCAHVDPLLCWKYIALLTFKRSFFNSSVGKVGEIFWNSINLSFEACSLHVRLFEACFSTIMTLASK